MIMKVIAAVLLFASAAYAQNSSTPSPVANTWKPLQFLIGTWEAKTQGGAAQAAGSGTYTFQPELRDHILARHSNPAECTGPAGFNCGHEDLLYVYQDAPGHSYKAIYFDNEGHVIHYDLSIPNPTTAVFLSDAAQPGPQFRLIYELKGSTMYGKFQMHMPGQTEFKSYLEWSGSKK